MKLNLLIILSFFLFTSCNKDDDSNQSTDNNFPVKLVFKNKIDELILKKNEQEQEPTEDEINTFLKKMKKH